MARRLMGVHFAGLLVLGAILTLPRFHGESTEALREEPKDLHVYLLIGESNMAGRAPIPEEHAGILDRCYLLNADNQWEPARAPLNRYSSVGEDGQVSQLGPGYAFARRMLEEQEDVSIGLIVNARADTQIEEWLGKSKLYWGARGRSKKARQHGALKGVLWNQGGSDQGETEGYLEKLQVLVGNLRSDLGDPNLPFVAGEIPNAPDFNAQLAELPKRVHHSAVAPANGLGTTDGSHFDAKGQLLLGERYAEAMLELQKGLHTVAPAPPSDIRFIDPHVHAMSVTPVGLRAVARWMDQRNVERCIVSPLSHQGSRPRNEQERLQMLENFRPYRGRIDRMCLIEPGEVATVEAAVALLRREKASGAVGFGEHYGKGLMFDDPKNLMLYEACEKVGLPVMFHIDQNKNMVEPGMKRVDRVLRMFPDCKVVAHAYWWRQLANGSCDRQLQEHPNLYADMSGHVVVNVLNRDRKYAREFLIRNQDKILWATDEGWWSFGNEEKQMNLHYTFLEELDLPDAVRHKIYRGNSERVYGLK